MKSTNNLYTNGILSLILLFILVAFNGELIGQGCTISSSNLTEISGDDGSGNCIYSIDILFIEGSGPDNGTLTFSSSNVTILIGAGPHSCACSGNTYTLTFEATCESLASFTVFHDNSGNGNDCSVSVTGISLPVEWLDFSVENDKNENVLLSWATATEVNNDAFEIEYSYDGISFEYLSTISGAGTSFRVNNYSFIYTITSNRSLYFRIKQIDYDGNFSYSDIKHIRPNKELTQFNIYPNPVSQLLTISGLKEGTTIKIYSLFGQLVLSSKQRKIYVGGLENGMYKAEIEDNGVNLSQLIVVTH